MQACAWLPVRGAPKQYTCRLMAPASARVVGRALRGCQRTKARPALAPAGVQRVLQACKGASRLVPAAGTPGGRRGFQMCQNARMWAAGQPLQRHTVVSHLPAAWPAPGHTAWPERRPASACRAGRSSGTAACDAAHSATRLHHALLTLLRSSSRPARSAVRRLPSAWQSLVRRCRCRWPPPARAPPPHLGTSPSDQHL